ncbi:helix-turn-helix domain-containing protein [Paenibacillus campinasensis]|nr:helix-turn-helix transcriptional regulator [Paenibacillus campinasensis]
MIKFKLDEVMFRKGFSPTDLSEATGIRWNSIDDMMKNRVKRVSIKNIEKIMEALELEEISQLIEYKKDPTSEK